MPDKRLSMNYYNKMLFVQMHLDNSKELLDVGCGEGGYFHMYDDHKIRYKGIDIDSSVLKTEKQVKLASAEKIPFPNNTFDIVVCMDVIEHVENDRAAISEIHRVLKTKGKLLLSVPNARYPITYDPLNALLRSFGRHINIGVWAWGHKRLYRRDEIKKLLKPYFYLEHIEEVTHAFASSFMTYLPYLSFYVVAPIMKRLGLAKKQKIRVSPKPIEKTSIFRFINFLNNLDKKHFSNTYGLTICAVARKI